MASSRGPALAGSPPRGKAPEVGGESLLGLLRGGPSFGPGPPLPPPGFLEAAFPPPAPPAAAPGPFLLQAPGGPCAFPFAAASFGLPPAAPPPPPPPPLPRPLALFPAQAPKARGSPPPPPRRRGPDRLASPKKSRAAPGPSPQPRFRFSAQQLHAVLYGPLGPGAVEAQPALLDRSALQLPEGLTILQRVSLDGPQLGVFCTQTISKAIRFGPFQGKIVNTSEIKTYDDNSLMWEIFEDGHLSHFIDGKGSSGNWMALVNCARFPEEQNLIAVQCLSEIYYESCKEILPGQELLVWYGDGYQQFLGIPISLKGTVEAKHVQQHSEESVEGYKCERCGKVFAYKYYRDKHLKYTRCVDQGDRKFPCHLCSRSFEKRDRLRIHVLHVHEKHRPHKCGVCGKSFSQSSSLNKHMRVHSGERPYKCVYCNKAFTASSILRTHIRQHSGEKPFKCKHCGKAFASHAAHDSHVRRTHSGKEKARACTVCGKKFLEPDEFRFHSKFHAAVQTAN